MMCNNVVLISIHPEINRRSLVAAARSICPGSRYYTFRCLVAYTRRGRGRRMRKGCRWKRRTRMKGGWPVYCTRAVGDYAHTLYGARVALHPPPHSLTITPCTRALYTRALQRLSIDPPPPPGGTSTHSPQDPRHHPLHPLSAHSTNTHKMSTPKTRAATKHSNNITIRRTVRLKMITKFGFYNITS